MNLARYTTIRISLLILILIGIWGAFFYVAMVNEIMDETDDELRSYREIIVSRAMIDLKLLEPEESIFYRYTISPVTTEEAANYVEKWEEMEVYFPIGDEHIPMRVYQSAFCLADGQCFVLDLRISTTERDDLLQSLFFYLILLYLSLVIFISISNYLILKKSFIPLQKLLTWLKSVTPGKPIPSLNNETPISEFKVLNEEALAMSRRNERTFEEQKQFIENASHELQTPLAIALNKLELLAENGSLSEDILKKIDDIAKPLHKAKKLNRTLVLLTQINNNQYNETNKVDIVQIVRDNLEDMKEIINYKKISITYLEENSCVVSMNDLLAQILILNLLKNAIVHTKEGGVVGINIDNDKFQISNSGETPLDSSKIFNRFYHSDRHRESTGLGLAIVYSIATLYHFDISYHYDNEHYFTIKFLPE